MRPLLFSRRICSPEAPAFRHQRQPALADATMRALGLTSILLILLWPVPQELEAQSLAEVARRERGRRALLPDAAVTYTNEAVRRYVSRSAVSSSGQPESGAPPGQSSLAEDNPVPTQEEHRWSQRFIRLKATVAAAEERHKTLQSRANALNLKLQGDPFHQTTVADPAHVYGPLIAQTQRQIQQNQQVLSRARQELADLREGLRKSGMPLSWADSQAALRLRPSQGTAGLPVETTVKDRAYWQQQLSLVDQRFRSRIAPLETERFQLVHRRIPRKRESLAVDDPPGLGLPPRVADIDLRIRQLRRRQSAERQALVEQALRSGALPGWFR